MQLQIIFVRKVLNLKLRKKYTKYFSGVSRTFMIQILVKGLPWTEFSPGLQEYFAGYRRILIRELDVWWPTIASQNIHSILGPGRGNWKWKIWEILEKGRDLRLDGHHIWWMCCLDWWRDRVLVSIQITSETEDFQENSEIWPITEQDS